MCNCLVMLTPQERMRWVLLSAEHKSVITVQHVLCINVWEPPTVNRALVNHKLATNQR
jgi:hypothetical protein